jgi:ORF6N domain
MQVIDAVLAQQDRWRAQLKGGTLATTQRTARPYRSSTSRSRSSSCGVSGWSSIAAAIYGVETRSLNQAVKRNGERFPEDFMFQLTAEEVELSRSQSVILNPRRGQNIKYLPYAFTEHGAIQAANILRSPRAVEMGIYVVRAFVKLRELLSSNRELARRFAQLETRLDKKLTEHDRAIGAILSAIRELMHPKVPVPKHRPMGFTADLEEKSWHSKRQCQAVALFPQANLPNERSVAALPYARRAGAVSPATTTAKATTGARAPKSDRRTSSRRTHRAAQPERRTQWCDARSRATSTTFRLRESSPVENHSQIEPLSLTDRAVPQHFLRSNRRQFDRH